MVTEKRLHDIVEEYEILKETMPTTIDGEKHWEQRARLVSLALQIDTIKALDAIFRRLQAP